MTVYTCYLCNEKLTSENKSVEHLILNSIGGKLKSSNLLCQFCNSKLGHECDAELAKQFEFLAAYLQVKRESGEYPIIKGGKTADGTEYYLQDGRQPMLAKPAFKAIPAGEGIQYSMTARSESELRQMLNGLKRKHPLLDVDEAVRLARRTKERLHEPISYNQVFGGDLAFRSILKTALNYFILQGGDRDVVNHLFGMLAGQHKVEVVKPFFPDKLPYRREVNEINHLLYLRGDKYSRLLYCYVEFFSIHSYLVILNDDYTGPRVSSSYAIDPVSGKITSKDVKLKLDRDFVTALPSSFSQYKTIAERTNRVIKIADKNYSSKRIDSILKNASEEIFVKKYGHEPRFTKQMITEYSELAATGFAEYLYG